MKRRRLHAPRSRTPRLRSSAMLLAVDIGNTQTHVGVFERRRARRATGASRPERDSTSDEIGARARRHRSSSAGIELDAARRRRSSRPSSPARHPSTSGSAERHLEAPLPARRDRPCKTGMAIRIDNPRELGSDRLVNAVAAYERFGGRLRLGRLRHLDQLRRRLRGRRVPRRRDRARAGDLDRGARGRTAKLPRIELAEPGAGDRQAARSRRSSRASSTASPGSWTGSRGGCSDELGGDAAVHRDRRPGRR